MTCHGFEKCWLVAYNEDDRMCTMAPRTGSNLKMTLPRNDLGMTADIVHVKRDIFDTGEVEIGVTVMLNP